ncbi:peptidoglycan recognition protein [Streptomyces macrosporus]|uniref:Peptidoglycan recognition protein family domain-containing protein n=1 Tax=Streptomyces macrosporus TaxID=44032 RepID=A0ABP5XDQ1_9ACTN
MWSPRMALGAALLPLTLLVIRDVPASPPGPPESEATDSAPPPSAPRPAIVSRADWHADESMVRERARYTGPASAVFVHHTGHPNGYDCDDVPAMLRALEVEHVKGEGWDDIGYNFVVDRCGTIYEGRAGGIERPVYGAHTKGFNRNSVGVAALGTYGEGQEVPRAVVDAIARVAAWKLRPGVDPRGTVRLVSTNDESRYDEGEAATFRVISGHRDSHQTDCPGQALYDLLPAIREETARLRRP